MRLALIVALVASSSVALVACSSGSGRRHNNSNQNKKDLSQPDEDVDLKGTEGPLDLKKTDSNVTTGVTIVSFEASPTSAVSEAPVTFTAVVEVDSGDSIFSVQLTDTNKTISYGEMSSTGFAGSYSRTMTWTAISDAQDLTFTSGSSRTFKVFVTTNSDKTAEKTVTVSFSCNGLVACSGQCVDTDSDNSNCGGCGIPCSTGCSGGSCGGLGSGALSTCVSASSKDTQTCSDICANQGSTCVQNGCDGATMVYHYNSACSPVTGTATGSCSTTLAGLHSGLIATDTVKCCCGGF